MSVSPLSHVPAPPIPPPQYERENVPNGVGPEPIVPAPVHGSVPVHMNFTGFGISGFNNTINTNHNSFYESKHSAPVVNNKDADANKERKEEFKFKEINTTDMNKEGKHESVVIDNHNPNPEKKKESAYAHHLVPVADGNADVDMDDSQSVTSDWSSLDNINTDHLNLPSMPQKSQSKHLGDFVGSFISQHKDAEGNPKVVVIPVTDLKFVKMVFPTAKGMIKSPTIAKEILTKYLLDKLQISEIYVRNNNLNSALGKTGNKEIDIKSYLGRLIKFISTTSKIWVSGSDAKRDSFLLLVDCSTIEWASKLKEELVKRNIAVRKDRSAIVILKCGPFSAEFRKNNTDDELQSYFTQKGFKGSIQWMDRGAIAICLYQQLKSLLLNPELKEIPDSRGNSFILKFQRYLGPLVKPCSHCQSLDHKYMDCAYKHQGEEQKFIKQWCRECGELHDVKHGEDSLIACQYYRAGITKCRFCVFKKRKPEECLNHRAKNCLLLKTKYDNKFVSDYIQRSIQNPSADNKKLSQNGQENNNNNNKNNNNNNNNNIINNNNNNNNSPKLTYLDKVKNSTSVKPSIVSEKKNSNSNDDGNSNSPKSNFRFPQSAPPAPVFPHMDQLFAKIEQSQNEFKNILEGLRSLTSNMNQRFDEVEQRLTRTEDDNKSNKQYIESLQSFIADNFPHSNDSNKSSHNTNKNSSVLSSSSSSSSYSSSNRYENINHSPEIPNIPDDDPDDDDPKDQDYNPNNDGFTQVKGNSKSKLKPHDVQKLTNPKATSNVRPNQFTPDKRDTKKSKSTPGNDAQDIPMDHNKDPVNNSTYTTRSNLKGKLHDKQNGQRT